MSLDIYAGSLAKYYSRDFETPQARFARENGIDYQLVYAGEAPAWPSVNSATAIIDGFCNNIASHTEGKARADWDDDVSDYFAEQLFEEARNALVLLAAYQNREDLVLPSKMPRDFDKDLAYSEAVEKAYYIGPMATFESALWLPIEDELLFMIDDPMGWKIVVNTHGNLEKALSALAAEVWSDKTDVAGWFERGPAPGRGATMQKRKFRLPWQSEHVKKQEEEPDGSLLWNAEYAFSVFTKALDFARKRRVPIRIDE